MCRCLRTTHPVPDNPISREPVNLNPVRSVNNISAGLHDHSILILPGFFIPDEEREEIDIVEWILPFLAEQCQMYQMRQ